MSPKPREARPTAARALVTVPVLLRAAAALPAGLLPVREGQVVVDEQGRPVGSICSACYGSSVGAPIAMAYIERELGEPGTRLAVEVRGKSQAVVVARMPFTPQRYFRG